MSGPGPEGPSRAVAALLLLLVSVPYAVSLGEPPLWDANEPLYAEPPREALEAGTLDAFLAPPWNHRPWFVRPPLSSWLTIPSYALLGPSPFAERLPMALAAIATLLAANSIGRSLGGRRTGLLAAAVLAATPRFWLFSRQLAGDVYLTAILTSAFALAIPALRGEPAGRRRLAVAHALVAVGCLAKGPAILALWLVPLVGTWALGRRDPLRRLPFRTLRPGALLVAVLLLGAPWFLYMTARYGGEYANVFFGHHHLRRVLSDEVGSRGPLHYLGVLLVQAQPWILVAPVAAALWWRSPERRDAGHRLVWLAAVAPVVLFSFARGKRDVYLMPVYPLLAAAVAPLLGALWAGAWRRTTAAYALLLTAAGLGFAVLVARTAGRIPDDVWLGCVGLVGVLVVAGVVLVVALSRRSTRGVIATTIAAVLALEAAAGLSMPILARWKPVPALSDALRPRLAPGDEVVVYRVALHSPMFYLRRPTVTARSPEEVRALVRTARGRVWVFARPDDLGALRPDLDVGEVARAPYLRFSFRSAVLGEGRSTADLVVASVGAPPDAGGTPR